MPEITLIVNLGLLFSLDWLSFLFGLQLALLGGVVFFFYSRKRVVRQQTGLHLALAENKPKFTLRTTERILMPVANPQTQRSTFALCNPRRIAVSLATQITERTQCSVAVVRILPIGRKLVTNV